MEALVLVRPRGPPIVVPTSGVRFVLQTAPPVWPVAWSANLTEVRGSLANSTGFFWYDSRVPAERIDRYPGTNDQADPQGCTQHQGQMHLFLWGV